MKLGVREVELACAAWARIMAQACLTPEALPTAFLQGSAAFIALSPKALLSCFSVSQAFLGSPDLPRRAGTLLNTLKEGNLAGLSQPPWI